MKITLCSIFTLFITANTFAQTPDSSKNQKDSTHKKVLLLNTYNPNPLGKTSNSTPNSEKKIDLKIDNSQKKFESNYVKDNGRIVGGSSTLKLGKKNN